jgi:hypothetical protein
MIDDIESRITAAAVAALRRRAARQREVAAARGDRSGEGTVALRIAVALDELALEFEFELAAAGDDAG